MPNLELHCAEFAQDCVKLGTQEIVPNPAHKKLHQIYCVCERKNILLTLFYLLGKILLTFLAAPVILLSLFLPFWASFTSQVCREICCPDALRLVQTILCQNSQCNYATMPDKCGIMCVFPVRGGGRKAGRTNSNELILGLGQEVMLCLS